jgi:hypothetical protein
MCDNEVPTGLTMKVYVFWDFDGMLFGQEVPTFGRNLLPQKIEDGGIRYL